MRLRELGREAGNQQLRCACLQPPTPIDVGGLGSGGFDAGGFAGGGFDGGGGGDGGGV